MTTIIKVGDKEITSYGNAQHSVGGHNRFYQFCEFLGQQRNYGCCSGLVDAYLLGQLKIEKNENGERSLTSCAYAMKSGQCHAVAKRQLEVKLDAAIFYKDKIVHDEELTKPANKNESYWRGWSMVGNALGKEETVAPVKKRVQAVIETPPKPSQPVISYENAINEAINNAN